jgi:murein DD-endopeptidase MepM/ murein hydrolase activator NlpD
VLKKQSDQFPSAFGSRPAGHFTIVILLVAAIVALIIATRSGSSEEESLPAPAVSASVVPVESDDNQSPTTPEPAMADEDPLSCGRTIEVTMGKGDNLFDVLRKEDVPIPCIYDLVTASRPVYNLSRVRLGQTCTLDLDENGSRILRFETDIDDSHRLIAENEGDGLRARKEAIEFDIRLKTASGTIEDSLFLAALDADLPPTIILSLAEIFGWDIDFHVDIRRDDTFRVTYEEKHLDGKAPRLGRVLAAEIVNQNEPFWAIYFEDGDGRGDYYDREGRSLRKAFLKSPLTYTRISSGFSYRRFHPIYKTYRPHLGVDYAAPLGTPIRSIGDGRVTFAGWKSGYGRFISVRHNDTYTTTYGHLNRFAKGIKQGKYVTQGQVIGYVGATGVATGPHLDFRLLKNGKFINPLRVNFPDADPVRKEDMPEFRRLVERVAAELESDGSIMLAHHMSLPGDNRYITYMP